MIATLPQLHFKIVLSSCLSSVLWKSLKQSSFIAFIKGSVDCFLESGHFDIDYVFLQGRDWGFNIFLLPSEDVGFENDVELLNLVCLGELSEVVLEGVETVELWGFDEVQQTPKLIRIILDWSSSQQHHPLAGQSAQSAQDLGLLVLQTVSFIDDHKLERNL